jgi:hypothetical protein
MAGCLKIFPRIFRRRAKLIRTTPARVLRIHAKSLSAGASNVRPGQMRSFKTVATALRAKPRAVFFRSIAGRHAKRSRLHDSPAARRPQR